MPSSSAPPEAPKPTGRAGRDLRKAILVSLLLATLALGSLFVVHEAFVVLAIAAAVVAVRELAIAVQRADMQLARPVLYLASVILLPIVYVGGPAALVLGVALIVPVLLVWHGIFSSPPRNALADATGSVLTLAYLPLLIGFAVLMLRPDDGPQRIVTYVLLVVCNDVGGYAAGVWLGKHPIAPSVSPKKSWEGAAGSVILCCSAGAIAVPTLLGGTWYAGVGLGLAVMVAATVGDFAESALKRDLGIKDMSNLLPGHGGLLDRLDSLLAAAPVAYLLLLWLVPVA